MSEYHYFVNIADTKIANNKFMKGQARNLITIIYI